MISHIVRNIRKLSIGSLNIVVLEGRHGIIPQYIYNKMCRHVIECD
jgi:hypothetical protein